MSRFKTHAKLATLAVVAVAALTGCLQSRTVVNVNPDGSGTVEETFLLQQQVVQMMAGMGGEEGSFSLLDRDELQRSAASMGDGVRLDTAEEHATDWGSGYRVVYAFDDINTLRVNQNPSDDMPSEAAEMGGEQPSAEEYIHFEMTRGRPATLDIIMPEMAEGEMEPAETPETGETGEMPQMSDEDMQGLAQMYRDMRISVDVVVNGSITESDATHVDGNRVTLVDMDFNQILQDSETMERLATQQADSISEVEAMVNDLPGIKAEVKQRIRVRFQ